MITSIVLIVSDGISGMVARNANGENPGTLNPGIGMDTVPILNGRVMDGSGMSRKNPVLKFFIGVITPLTGVIMPLLIAVSNDTVAPLQFELLP